MRTLGTAALIMISLRLASPVPHALALCMDSDGSFALKAVVDGACAGSGSRGDDRERASTEALGLAADVVECRGGCTDVVLGGGAVVPPPVFSGKHKLPCPADEAVDPTVGCAGSALLATAETNPSSSVPAPVQSRTCRSVVLKL